RAMNAPFVMPIITAASKRSRSMSYPSPHSARGGGPDPSPASPPRLCTSAGCYPLLRDRELLDERPAAALGLRARELGQGGVAVRVERPLAQHAVVVLGAGHVGQNGLPVVGLVAGGRDRCEDDLRRLVAVDRIGVRVVVVVLRVVALEPVGGLAGVLLRRNSTEGRVHALVRGWARLLQELGAVDAVRAHELD